MTFSSITYLIFFTVICLFFALTNCLKKKCGLKKIQAARHFALLLASYVFYGWWDYRFCFLMLGLTVVSYITARVVSQRGKYTKAALVIGVSVPLLILGVFKYFNFFIQSFADLFGITSVSALAIILPVGISFYTFQSLSYTIDVYRGKVDCQKNFVSLALYIAFFPQLVAGPIVKAGDFLPQLQEDRSITLKNLEQGLQIFLLGLLKKLVIADHLSVFVDDVFAKPMAFSGGTVLLAVVAYSIQIYFDFSGYSDMAIGSAKCLGFDLNKNFDLPYLSRNVSEFWKRWHISLSSWLMEYLYIPLGGNRKGTVRTYINLILTMLLGGLWHGANWTFVLWGLFHGIGLCLHKIYRKIRRLPKDCQGSLPVQIASAVGTYLFVCAGWVLFRAESVREAFAVFKAIGTLQTGISQPFIWVFVALACLVIGTLLMAWKSRKQKEKGIHSHYPCLPLDKVWGLTVFFLFVLLAAGLAYTESNPFIYFQF